MLRAFYSLLFVATSFSFAQVETNKYDTLMIDAENGNFMVTITNFSERKIRLLEFENNRLKWENRTNWEGIPIDTQFMYYPNRLVAAQHYYPEENYCQEFILFDTSGIKYFTGSFSNNIRIGNWYAYNKTGKIIASTHYKHTLENTQNEELVTNLKGDSSAILVNEFYHFKDFGMSFEKSYGANITEKTYGIPEKINTYETLPVSNSCIYFKDAILGYFPLSPYPAIEQFVTEKATTLNYEFYLENSIYEPLGIPVVNIFFYPENGCEKYFCGFSLLLCEKSHSNTLIGHLKKEGYSLYESKIKKHQLYYIPFETRSYSAVILLEPFSGKHAKVLKKLMPTFVENLKSFGVHSL